MAPNRRKTISHQKYVFSGGLLNPLSGGGWLGVQPRDQLTGVAGFQGRRFDWRCCLFSYYSFIVKHGNSATFCIRLVRYLNFLMPDLLMPIGGVYLLSIFLALPESFSRAFWSSLQRRVRLLLAFAGGIVQEAASASGHRL